MFKSKQLSKLIIIETIIIIIIGFLLAKDNFSNFNILDFIIKTEPAETLLIEESSPDSLSKVRIYEIDSPTLYHLSIRVDFIISNNSKTYSYYSSVDTESIPTNNQYYSIQWESNTPYIYISGNPTISITYAK